MKTICLIIGFFFFGTWLNDGEKIKWQEDRPLSWSDFRATPHANGAYVASTNSGISFSYSIRSDENGWGFEYSVQSNFYPNRSWYRPKLADNYILAHEQTHFDISELFARKFRKQLSELKVDRNVKSLVDGLYAQIEQQRRDMQQQYDKETDHSKIRESEFRWRDFVSAELVRYEDWR
jgi:hypothetical protein